MSWGGVIRYRPPGKATPKYQPVSDGDGCFRLPIASMKVGRNRLISGTKRLSGRVLLPYRHVHPDGDHSQDARQHGDALFCERQRGVLAAHFVPRLALQLPG